MLQIYLRLYDNPLPDSNGGLECNQGTAQLSISSNINLYREFLVGCTRFGFQQVQNLAFSWISGQIYLRQISSGICSIPVQLQCVELIMVNSNKLFECNQLIITEIIH